MVTFVEKSGPGSGGADGSPGALLIANNLSDLGSASTARTSLGLGSSATHPASDFATVGGLYAPVLSNTVPTQANTGLTTLVNNTGLTVSDGANGIVLRGATVTDRISGISKAAPSTPYSIDVIIEHFTVLGGGFGPLFGWYDGTKLHTFGMYTNTSGFPILYVLGYPTTASGSSASGGVFFTGTGINTHPSAVRITDDGTNVHFSINLGGNYGQAEDVYTIAKASGYLGATGYSNIFFGINRNNGLTMAALMSMIQR